MIALIFFAKINICYKGSELSLPLNPYYIYFRGIVANKHDIRLTRSLGHKPLGHFDAHFH